MLAFNGGWVSMVSALMPGTGGLTRLPVPDQIPVMFLAGNGTGLSVLPANTACVSLGDAGQRAATVERVKTLRQPGGGIGIVLLSQYAKLWDKLFLPPVAHLLIGMVLGWCPVVGGNPRPGQSP